MTKKSLKQVKQIYFLCCNNFICITPNITTKKKPLVTYSEHRNKSTFVISHQNKFLELYISFILFDRKLSKKNMKVVFFYARDISRNKLEQQRCFLRC